MPLHLNSRLRLREECLQLFFLGHELAHDTVAPDDREQHRTLDNSVVAVDTAVAETDAGYIVVAAACLDTNFSAGKNHSRRRYRHCHRNSFAARTAAAAGKEFAVAA